MRQVEYSFGGRMLYLSFSAEALFRCYDRFGVTDNLIGDSHILDATSEGWMNCCWVGALLASQGELQRRHMGYEPMPMVSMEELRTGIMPDESMEFRHTVLSAMELGVHRAVPSPQKEEDEVNLILQEREAAEKKQKGLTH